MTTRLAVFTTCKPFEGKFGAIQRNALWSWKRLGPGCEIIVFGDEPGVAECCQELGCRQIAAAPRSEYGAPLLNGLFEAVERATGASLFAFVNADIILTSDLLPAIEAVSARFPRFLLIARRWNVEIGEAWDFGSPNWESELRLHARAQGMLEPAFGGIDLFVYPRGAWGGLPAFAVGRGRWDSALIYEARRRGVPVIDATEVVTCVHQAHDYSHHPESTSGVFKGPEARRNEELLGGDEFIFTSLNATHVLRKSGLRRNVILYPPYILRWLATLPGLYGLFRPLAPAVRYLAPWWRRIRTLDPRLP